ncbi:MAG TPA: FAD-dependent oxidoreductase [Capsulimonadaceae bacterium]
MATHTLAPREIPLDDTYDVIVVGGGPSGCTAAAAAARDGAKTLLIESTGCLGGMGTSALVPAWCPFSDKEKIIYRGLGERILMTMKEQTPHVPKEQVDWVAIDAERLKRIYDDIVLEFGAKVLFNTLLTSVETDGDGTVTTIIAANKAGLRAYRAKVYIDCTGDADLTAWAGAEYHLGDDSEDGRLMPATHCFVISNVDDYAYRTGPNLYGSNPESPIHKIMASGKYPLVPDLHMCSNIVGPGAVGFNAGHMWHVDNTKPETISEALVHGRKMAAQYRDGLAEFFPAAFANSFLTLTGSLMGIRETRRIVGDYVLTLEDYMARRSFDDEICRNSYFIDVHWAADNIAKDLETQAKWEKNNIHYGKGESHGIPYRCLTPKGLTNVIVAGRSISCEQIVQGSVRVMPVCLAMGEAAGAAAAQALGSDKVDVHSVDVTKLRDRLREAGGYLP